MSHQRKSLIVIIAMILLGVLIATPITHIASLGIKYGEALPHNHILETDELNDFLGVWAKFLRSGLGQTMRQVSLSQDDDVPAQVERWLENNDWSAERFFAIEQKLMNLVAIASLINSLEDNRKFLSNAKDIAGDNLKNIIKNQENQIKNAKYNQQELDLVRANLYSISQVLEGKAIMEK